VKQHHTDRHSWYATQLVCNVKNNNNHPNSSKFARNKHGRISDHSTFGHCKKILVMEFPANFSRHLAKLVTYPLCQIPVGIFGVFASRSAVVTLFVTKRVHACTHSLTLMHKTLGCKTPSPVRQF